MNLEQVNGENKLFYRCEAARSGADRAIAVFLRLHGKRQLMLPPRRFQREIALAVHTPFRKTVPR